MPALSRPVFTRAPGGPLPTIVVTTPPQNAAAEAVGQFIHVTGIRAAAGSRDRLRYRVEYEGASVEESLELVYRDVCKASDPDEKLIYLPAGRYFAPSAGPNLPASVRAGIANLFPGGFGNVDATLERVSLATASCIQAAEQYLTPELERQLERDLRTEFRPIRREMQTDRLARERDLNHPDRRLLRWISFHTATKVAEIKSRAAPNKVYRIPQAHQWLAGLVVALEMGDLQIAGTIPFSAFKDSYLAGMHEWVDTQYARSPNSRYLLGPSIFENDKWLLVEEREVNRGQYGVRLVRDP